MKKVLLLLLSSISLTTFANEIESAKLTLQSAVRCDNSTQGYSAAVLENKTTLDFEGNKVNLPQGSQFVGILVGSKTDCTIFWKSIMLPNKKGDFISLKDEHYYTTLKVFESTEKISQTINFNPGSSIKLEEK